MEMFIHSQFFLVDSKHKVKTMFNKYLPNNKYSHIKIDSYKVVDFEFVFTYICNIL